MGSCVSWHDVAWAEGVLTGFSEGAQAPAVAEATVGGGKSRRKKKARLPRRWSDIEAVGQFIPVRPDVLVAGTPRIEKPIEPAMTNLLVARRNKLRRVALVFSLVMGFIE